jgi:hypothetical protein
MLYSAGMSSRSPKRPIVNPYRPKPRDVIVAKRPFPGLGQYLLFELVFASVVQCPHIVVSLEEKGGDLSNSIVKVWKHGQFRPLHSRSHSSERIQKKRDLGFVDDGMISVTSTEKVKEDEKNQRTAYMRLYTLDELVEIDTTRAYIQV